MTTRAKALTKKEVGGSFKHGVSAAPDNPAMRMYSDKRHAACKMIDKQIQGVREYLGDVTEVQELLLQSNIRPKLVIMHQIGAYLDNLDSIFNKDGSLIAVLGKNYLAYTNALRRDLQAIIEMSAKRPAKVMSIEEIIRVDRA